MIELVYAALIVAGAYLLGSVPSGLLLARRRGVDIREFGSGNIGAVNVTRSLGKKLGALVLVLDALKGALPVLLVLGLELHHDVDPFVLTLTGAAAIAGHCFSIWLGFHGGKGVATALGVFVVLSPAAAGIAVLVFGLVYVPFRVASLGSVLGSISMPVSLLLLGASDAVVTLAVAAGALIVFTHRENLGRLVRGQEHKV